MTDCPVTFPTKALPMDASALWAGVSAIGTCVGAVAAVLTIRKTRNRPAYLRLEGRWRSGINDEWPRDAHRLQ
jgi:hypothetical protein